VQKEARRLKGAQSTAASDTGPINFARYFPEATGTTA
jgi:hypothetical protein